MKFDDVVVSREGRFSIGVEAQSGRYYVSIPVSNGMVDYEEYYEIDRATFDLYCQDPNAARDFVERCRRREEDARLIVKPGTNRGTAI